MDWEWEILLCMNNILDGTQSPDSVRIDSKTLQGQTPQRRKIVFYGQMPVLLAIPDC